MRTLKTRVAGTCAIALGLTTLPVAPSLALLDAGLADLSLLALLPALDLLLAILGGRAAHPLAFALAGARHRVGAVAPFLPPVATILRRIAPVLPDIAAIITPVPTEVLTVGAPLLLVLPTLLPPILPLAVLHRKAPPARAIIDPRAVSGIIEVVVIAAAKADLAKAEACVAAVEAVPRRIAIAIRVIAAGKAAAAHTDADTAIAAITAAAISAGGQGHGAQCDGGDADSLAAVVLKE